MKERLMSELRRWAWNWRSLFLAFVWVLFMFFFTYTTLFEELLKKNGNFPGLFYEEQSSFIALYVNIGLVIMLLFDNHAVNKKFRGAVYYIPIMGLVVAFFLMGHCYLVKSGEHVNYIFPLSTERLSYVIYAVFLLMLYVMKVRSLIPDEVSVKKVLN
jgi:hypothetical protein